MAIAIVVNPSGKALPTAITVKPKYVLLKLVRTPTKFNRSTNKPQAYFDHNIPVKIPNKSTMIKYLGIFVQSYSEYL